MPICPQCKTEIDELTVERAAEDILTFNGQEFHYQITVLTRKYENYLCPNCLFKIAENEEDAKEFLSIV